MLREKVFYILKKYPDRIADVVENMHELYPDEVEKFIDECCNGYHIKNDEMYNQAIKCLTNFDGSKGGHWSVETIESKSQNYGIDLEKADYTEYDLAYAVNMVYSDMGDFLTIDQIFKGAKRFLEDKDFYGDPSERSYLDAKKRIKYCKEV